MILDSPSGGIIFIIPKGKACCSMDSMYFAKFLNSSLVGLNSGQSRTSLFCTHFVSDPNKHSWSHTLCDMKTSACPNCFQICFGIKMWMVPFSFWISTDRRVWCNCDPVVLFFLPNSAVWNRSYRKIKSVKFLKLLARLWKSRRNWKVTNNSMCSVCWSSKLKLNSEEQLYVLVVKSEWGSLLSNAEY